jgi:beta-lactam-binding protein with PASTA domain
LPFLTTTTTTKPTPPLVALPNVIGQRIAPARAGLRAANLRVVYLTRSCNRGTLASQSVVIALGLPGPAPNYAVGARQLTPGDLIPKGTVVGIEWSGCFGGGTTVPNIVGQTFGAARSSLHQVGLTWTCSNTTNTTIPHDNIVLSQSPVPGSAVAANTIVAFVMNHCPAFAPK